MEWAHVALAGVWGGLLALERRAFLQAMLSRPLVAAASIGLLLDDVRTGVFVGMVLELFHLGQANLGAALPENDTLSATCTAAAAAPSNPAPCTPAPLASASVAVASSASPHPSGSTGRLHSAGICSLRNRRSHDSPSGVTTCRSHTTIPCFPSVTIACFARVPASSCHATFVNPLE